MMNRNDWNGRRQPRYVIHVAARLCGLQPRVLRRYERLGLLDGDFGGAARRARARPFYTDADLERVRLIRRLVEDLGVNLAGAEVILNMRERMLQLHEEMERLRRQIDGHPGNGLR